MTKKSSRRALPAKADLLVWEVYLGILTDIVGLFSDILGFIRDLFDFTLGEEG